MTKRQYSRVYWEVPDDPKFADIWDDDARLATWMRLLVAADMAWPASAALYHGINQKVLKVLVEVHLVDMQAKGRYRIHGLDTERNERAAAGRESANIRWHGTAEGVPAYLNGDATAVLSSNATALRTHSGPNASQDETRRVEKRRVENIGRTSPTGSVDERPRLGADGAREA